MGEAAQLEFEMRFGGGSDPDAAGAVAGLLAGYRPEPGLHDELLGTDGRPRAPWLPVLAALGGLGPAEVRRRFDVADRHLADAGVVYRVYGDPAGAERPWPLAHLPLVLSEADWADLAAGVRQRAELLEAVLRDLYGEARLVSDGLLPAALVAGNREFLRPLAGVVPPGGRFLHVYAADVSRGPDGRWWVLSDKTQAPSGAGYAIENRIAIGARAMPDLFRALNVERLTEFYQALRAGLAQATGRTDPKIALLSPGPANETYFEHAYLARALGFLLVEGGDLTVSGGAVHLRTVDGPIRADVILRRLDADFADPLELNAASRIGVPGLVDVVRRGGVVMANALGAGLVEAPALLAFLPVLARRLLGEDLRLPNLATWWCGEAGARDAVLARFAATAIVPAFGRSLPGVLDSQGLIGATLTAEERRRLTAAIERRGIDFVGQEPVRLGTTPVFEAGRLQPRPFALRIFAVAGPNGWTVMPGGLCRISDKPDARSLSMQRGGRSADTWVIAERPVTAALLIPEPEEVEARRDTGALPSRAADNLFWLGRYLERAEATLRLVRGLAGQTSDDGPDGAGEPSARRMADVLVAWGAAPFGLDEPERVAQEALWGRSVGAVPQIVQEARRTASVVRDRLSPDAWRTLAGLARRFAPTAPPAASAEAGTEGHPDDLFDTADRGLRTIAAFVGLTREAMYRPGGWRFLDMGLRLERAIAVARFARRLTEAPATADHLARLLDLTDSQVLYRARYIAGPAPRPILDLVVLDDAHPRSVAFQVTRLVDHLRQLDGAGRRAGGTAGPGQVESSAVTLAAQLAAAEPGRLDPAAILAIETRLMAVSDAITRRYFGDQGGEADGPAAPPAVPPAAAPAPAVAARAGTPA